MTGDPSCSKHSILSTKGNIMKTIIAGGRDYHFTKEDVIKLFDINITLVISGGAQGADRCGEGYAMMMNIPLHVEKANWGRYAGAAGPIRNGIMAKMAEQLVIFPGGRGSENMLMLAKKQGLVIHNFMNKEQKELNLKSYES
jgi:predicted Rossmann-fold nucleotide-binding protein